MSREDELVPRFEGLRNPCRQFSSRAQCGCGHSYFSFQEALYLLSEPANANLLTLSSLLSTTMKT